jgi:hypothetical protein
MSYRNIRPLHILWQEGISDGVLNCVFLGIMRTLSLAEVLEDFPLRFFTQRRESDWLHKSGKLRAYRSLDWHIQEARICSKLPGHLNSTVLLNSLRDNQTNQAEPRYELVVVKEPLHWHNTSLRKVEGIGRHEQGAVLTTYRHSSKKNDGSEEEKKKRRLDFSLSMQMLVMHELGHVFGLFTKGTGKENPTDEEIKATHCLNDCVMYWQDDDELNKKIEPHPFCPSCLEKLKEYFVEPPTIIIDVDDPFDF